MIAPEIPFDEKQRLEKLRALKILDSAPEERFDRLTRMAKRMFNVDVSVVSLIDENRQWFKSRAEECNLPDETHRDLSFCGHAILGEQVFVVEDALLDERFHDNPMVTSAPNIRFYAGYPLKVNSGSALGTLCIFDREPRRFDPDELQLLQDLGAMAEQEIAALQLATLDELTLISNRRGYTDLARHVLNVCHRKGLKAAVVLIDLNKFKPINDRFGHAEGDRALVVFANALRSVFRKSDTCGRIGGDEFAVFMLDADEHDAQEAIGRLRDNLAQYNQASQRGYDIEFSAGYVISQPDADEQIEDLLKQADARMYAVKPASGR
ncbi:MAG: diguanylate cyclase [Gammaproteobacteria bacterium RIFCSPLOWO2_02_FULL_57_10]|nr:MAG: diguanylate cyclase [Gammaproteobacteria bacterium RIFCSPLOWO2_02_FULL_57_10]